MFEWNPRKIHFRSDAARRTQFHRIIAEKLAEKFDDPASVSLCDAGCGLGYLSLALAEYFGRVSAIDISPIALDILRSEAEIRNLTNIEIRQEDLLGDPAVRPEQYDTMVFSFFGNIDEIMHIARPRCRNKIFILKKNDHHHRFSVSHAIRPYDTMGHALTGLNELDLPFSKEDMSIEDGQPLRSLDEAEEFFNIYARGSDRELITRDYIRSLLTETGDSEFPYYYQRECIFSILTVDMAGYGGTDS